MTENKELTKQVSISDFLLSDITELEETKELNFPQFKAPWILRSLGADEFTQIRRQATKKVRSKTGQIIQDTDSEKLSDLLVEASVTQPNLRDEELQEYYGTPGNAVGTARRMLKVGQFLDLTRAINELNGFDDEETVDKLEKEVKN